MPVETLHQLVAGLADRGDAVAVVAVEREEVRRWSFAQLAGDAAKVAGALQQSGLEPGQHVAIFAPNSPRWIVACLALIQHGAVPVPIDAQMGDDDLEHVLNDSEARWVFTTEALARRLDELDSKSDRRLVLLDGPDDDERSWARLLDADTSAGRDGSGDGTAHDAGGDDEAVLFYTSGTTGAPKGVPLTHGNLCANIEALLEQELVGPDDRLLLPLPLHHVYPFTVGLLSPLAAGVAIILPPSLTGPQLMRAMDEGKVTAVLGVPRFYEALLAAIRARVSRGGRIVSALFSAALATSRLLRRYLRLSVGRWLFAPLHKRLAPHLRVLASGGSAIDEDVAWTLEALGWRVCSGYGLTETSPILSFNPPEISRNRIGSAGMPLPNVELRISDPVEHAEHGEVLARGPSVFAGYRNLPEKTEKSFTDDGYFRTGDLGYLDDAGYLYLVGRASAMIVLSGGENIRPDHVEEALGKAPSIREAGVLEHDDKLVALIVPDVKAGGGEREGDDGDDLRQRVQKDVEEASQKLPSHHRISDFQITRDPLPRTRLSKLRRHKLEERYEQAQREKDEPTETGPMDPQDMAPEDRQLLDDPAARAVWDWLAERYRDVRLTPDTNTQTELGIESLDWLDMTMEISARAGVELDDEAIGSIQSVRDLLERSAEAAGEAQAEGRSLEDMFADPEGALEDKQRRWLTPPGPVRQALAEVGFALNRLVMRYWFKLQVVGLENVPTDTAIVLTPNHESHLDPFAIAAALQRDVRRRTWWGGWTGAAFSNPVKRFFSRLAQVVPVLQSKGVMSSLAVGAAVLKRGDNLVWFPEGERSHDGKLQDFKPGIGMLLEHYDNVAAVPVRIEGSHEAMPRGSRWPRRHALTVTFGKPQTVRELEQAGEGEEAHERIASALRDLVAAI